MNRKGLGRTSLAIVSAALWFCQAAGAGKAGSQEFSADMVSRSGGRTEKARVYVSGEKLRTEMGGSIVIVRPDKNISWMVMPEERMYMEQKIDRTAVPKTSKEMAGEVERVPLGKETLNGIPVEKFKITYRERNTPLTVYQWLTDSEFPLKTEAIDGSWSVEYKNMSFGPQPDQLFEPPAGYQKFSMPSPGGAGSMSLSDIMSQMDAE